MDHLCVSDDRNYSEPAGSQYSSGPPEAQILEITESAYCCETAVNITQSSVWEEISPVIINAVEVFRIGSAAARKLISSRTACSTLLLEFSGCRSDLRILTRWEAAFGQPPRNTLGLATATAGSRDVNNHHASRRRLLLKRRPPKLPSMKRSDISG